MEKTTPVTAAGGILFKETDGTPLVLLIFRRGVWDLPKGKKEEDESVRACARREVAEEVGCPLPKAYDKLTLTYHEYEEDGVRYGKTTHWFPMQTETDRGFEPEKREGIVKVEWYPLDEARKKLGFGNLVEVLDAFESWYRDKRA